MVFHKKINKSLVGPFRLLWSIQNFNHQLPQSKTLRNQFSRIKFPTSSTFQNNLVLTHKGLFINDNTRVWVLNVIFFSFFLFFFPVFKFCHSLSFEFCNILSFWILSQFEFLSCHYLSLSFVIIWILWVLSQWGFR